MTKNELVSGLLEHSRWLTSQLDYMDEESALVRLAADVIQERVPAEALD